MNDRQKKLNLLEQNKQWRETMKAMGWSYMAFMVPSEVKQEIGQLRKRLIKDWVVERARNQLKGLI